jgi:SPP1 family predicted phage head-tail adaptor
MQVGRYRHIITIQRKAASTDAYGGDVFTWSEVCKAWAKVMPLTGRDLMAADAEQHEGKVRFFIRYLAGIEPTMRIVWQGRYHEIISVADVRGEGKEIELLTRVGTNVG